MVYYLERQYDEAEKLFGETEGNPFWAILTRFWARFALAWFLLDSYIRSHVNFATLEPTPAFFLSLFALKMMNFAL